MSAPKQWQGVDAIMPADRDLRDFLGTLGEEQTDPLGDLRHELELEAELEGLE